MAAHYYPIGAVLNTSPEFSHSMLSRRIAAAMPLLALISLVFLLWLPFGWQIGFDTDEWTTMGDIQEGNLITESVRPFEVVSWYIAYHMTPDNLYIGINVLVMLLIMVKGILSYRLLCDLDFSWLYAFGTAVLVVLYPADKGVFYLGALTIHASIFTYLLSVWLLVQFWKSGRWWLWIPIALVTGCCVCLYEGIYPLILFVPLVLIYLQGGISRRVIITSVLWFVVPLIFGLRVASILFLNNSANTYQSSLLANDHSLGTILASIGRTNIYSLVEAWVSAAWQTFTNGIWLGVRTMVSVTVNKPYLGNILLEAGIGLVTSIALMRYSPKINISKKRLVLVLVMSPVLLSLGFLLYSLTNLRDTNMRTLLHASLGAALFVSTLLWILSGLLRGQRVIYMLGLVFLSLIATYSLLIQVDRRVAAGQAQIPFMQKIVRTVPEIAPNSMLVFIDESPDREMEHLFRISYYFSAPVKVIYGDPTLHAVICYPQVWSPYEETCHFQANQFQWLLKDQPVWTQTYDHLVIFHYRADKTLQLETDISAYTDSEQAKQLYAPEKLISTNAPLPIRARTMLDMLP